MIDAHAHLDDPKFAGEAEAVLQRAAAAGVEAIIVAGVDLDSSRALLALADRREGTLPEALEGGAGSPQLHVAVGFHPHEASKCGRPELQELRALASHPRVVAIGEIGLDYHYEHSRRDAQWEAFVRQLDLARALRLPVVVDRKSVV